MIKSGGAFILALLLACLGIYFIYLYLRGYQKTVSDLGLLVEHIAAIKNGARPQPLQLKPDADMYETAQNINSIQEGIALAVAEQTKAERMKVQLITKVPH